MYSAHNQQSGKTSRRQFLRALGIGSVVLGTARVLPGQAQQRFVLSEDRFGRMFPQLPAFFERVDNNLKKAMEAMGVEGGILDAKDDLKQGPILLITDPNLSTNNPNNLTHTAGTTFMGQFMDHDMTFDLTSRLGVPTRPENSVNTRTPTLDLDSVYGGGPDDDPELYTLERGRAPKFKIGFGGLFEDLPRRADNTAIIADPRNDENLVIAGLHAAFLLFHNKAVEHVEQHSGRRMSPDDVFNEARRLTTWHYQWMILHEFLPLFIGPALVDNILRTGRKFYRPSEAFMPVEFQGAAYRFGHTMVRPSYRANLKGDNGAAFFAMVFDPAGQGEQDPRDLRGGARAPRRFIGWQTFFDFGPSFTDPGATTPAVKPNKQIDTNISTPLFRLPLAAIASGDPPISLPQRNLLRHITWSLSSGQRIAREMRLPSEAILSSRELSELDQFREFGHNLTVSTPLWYYILKEGELRTGGRHLGPVGGRIVGEVIVGLLQLDRRSYLRADRPWRPTLPTRSGNVTGDFRMIDFLTFAGVAPDQRGQ